jgi:hypothetical protein
MAISYGFNSKMIRNYIDPHGKKLKPSTKPQIATQTQIITEIEQSKKPVNIMSVPHQVTARVSAQEHAPVGN